jgi:NADH-quinone oxidoreductase subunit L
MTGILTILILTSPLAAAAVIAVWGEHQLKGRAHWPAVIGVGLSLLCSLLLWTAGGQEKSVHLWDWIPSVAEDLSWFAVEFHVDSLTRLMLTTVTFVSTLVVIYSSGYMRTHDGAPQRGYARYFAFICLFVFSMCTLVLGGNFLLLYLGWEAVGLCSYLLIGFYYQRPAAAAAAKKAFLVNRVGDFGFLIGILLIYSTFGTLDFAEVFAAVENGAASEGRLTAITLLLFCGAVGKSAQLPLHVWLPDAMEGPSPVSALIHAATMVTAGVYMVARCGVMFFESSISPEVVGWVGGLTALFAATIAVAQYDMKRILAYSTISQLGFMFMALGAKAPEAAIFHLFTHAFFKALLFLGAGAVMHAMHDVIDVRQFGGLRKSLPGTFRTFFIGSAALAGFPFLSGFWSKDAILHAVWNHSLVLGLIGIVTAAITAFYTFRMVFLAFFGEERLPDGVEHAHDPAPSMSIPLWILAVGALLAGYLGWSIGSVLHLDPDQGEHSGALLMMVISSIVALGGIGLAYLFYVRRPQMAATLASSAPGLRRLLAGKYFVDELYNAVISRTLWLVGRFCEAFDNYVIDALVWLASALPRIAGFAARGFQRGAVQGYGLSMLAGMALILVCFFLFGK